MSSILRYFSMVKFSHTIFAMPFALIGYSYALWSTESEFEWLVLVKVILAMVFARNTAMGFNRYADRDVDALNPRTALREIPSGAISTKGAVWFIVINAVLFLCVALWINILAFYLSPIALGVCVGYSYTKRFTSWSHIVLGTALGIAPVGAYVAVTGAIGVVPILLMGLVISWCSGFDILYSLQDREFDKEHSLHSVPVRYGAKGAKIISCCLHLITVYAVFVIGRYYGGGTMYWVGSGLFVALLIMQHLLFTVDNVSRIGKSFGLVNGCASICYATFTILDMWL